MREHSSLPVVIPEIAVRGSWAVDLACAIDVQQPGFLGAYLRSSARRRQVVHAILGHHWAAANDDARSYFSFVGSDLLARREAEVISAHLGACPPGFLKLLAKLGEHALPRDFYARLHRLCSDPTCRTSVAALRHLDKIERETLDIVESLPAHWRRIGLIGKLESAREARDFLRSIAFIRQNCPAATDTALNDAVKHLCRAGTVADFVSVWLYRCHFPRGPLSDSDDLHLVRDGQELSALGMKMRNCLREQITDILKGHAAFYVIRGFDRDVVVKLERPSRRDPWEFDDVYISGNQRVEHDLRRAVIDLLGRNGFDAEHKEQRVSSDDDALQHFLWRARRHRRR